MHQYAVVCGNVTALNVDNGVLAADGDRILDGVDSTVPHGQRAYLGGHTHDAVDMRKIAAADGGAVVKVISHSPAMMPA